MFLSTTTWYLKFGAAICLLWLFFHLVRRYFRRMNYKLPPGPFALPLIGHVGVLNHATLWTHREKYGDISYVNIFGIDIVIFNSVDVIRDAFQNQKTAEVFSARPPSFSQRELLREDIVLRSIDAKNWKQSRQIFHTLLKQYGEGILELETVVSQELEYVIDSLNAKIGQDVDVEDYLKPSLINILTILLIGERFERDHWVILTLLDMYKIGNFLQHPFVDMTLRTLPFLASLPIGLGASYQHLLKANRRLLQYVYHDRKNIWVDKVMQHKGIVYEMIKLRDVHTWIQDDLIEGVILDMLGAGFTTTDASLRTFFLLMIKHPEVQRKIQNEIDEVIGTERYPALSDRSKMPYTIATILELSRYSAVVAMSVPHACSRDIEFRGYTIPRDAIIIPNLFRVNHDSNVWESPSEFDPTRFLDKSGTVLHADHPNRRNLIPFGVGKRVCMGEIFAKTRIYLYVTYLLQAFTVKAVDVVSCDPLKFSPNLIVGPPPFRVRIERRRPK